MWGLGNNVCITNWLNPINHLEKNVFCFHRYHGRDVKNVYIITIIPIDLTQRSNLGLNWGFIRGMGYKEPWENK